MLRISALLFALNCALSLVMGARYAARREFMPYQARAVGRDFASLEPGVQTVVLAMLKVVGGGFLAFGASGLALAFDLAQGDRAAGFALTASSALLLVPAYLAAASVVRFAPQSGAPTRLTLAAPAVTLAAFLCLLAP